MLTPSFKNINGNKTIENHPCPKHKRSLIRGLHDVFSIYYIKKKRNNQKKTPDVSSYNDNC